MKNRVLIRAIFVITAVYFGVFLSNAQALSTRGRVLNEINVNTVGDYREIEIGFNFPVRYAAHFPRTSGNEVRIQFQPLRANIDTLEALESRESLFPPSNNLNVVRVEYEGKDMIDPTITVSFDRLVDFEVRQGEDFRSLIVKIPLPEDQVAASQEPTSIVGIVSRYVINLITSTDPIEKDDYPPPEKTKEYTVYESKDEKADGTFWNRLSVGFFQTFSKARKIADDLFLNDFPDLWIEKASLKEVADNGGDVSSVSSDEGQVLAVIPTGLAPEKEQSFLKEGEETMVAKDYSRAIQVYTKLLESTDPQIREKAQYQLALAREYYGHTAHAKAEYRNYLRAFPEGHNVEEARNRLKKLLSARPLMAGDARDSGKPGEKKWESEYYGSISTQYDYDKSFGEDADPDDSSSVATEDITNVSSIITSVDATYRLRTENYQLTTVFIGSYESTFLDDEEDDPRVSSLYLDFETNTQSFVSRWGRQSGNSGGVLGRFDGGKVGFRLSEKIHMNLVAGFPVNLSSDPLETDKYFYGINFDLGRFAEHWDYNLYFINQISEGIDDRRAVGGELRYVGNRGSFFTLLDYDILYDDLNTVLVTGNYMLSNKKTWLNFSLDFRNSPTLSTSNALIGQTIQSLEALEVVYGEEALRNLAEDRTLDSKFVTLGFSHTFSDVFQMSGDVSWSKLGGAPASGGVEEFEAADDDWYYSLQFSGSNFFTEGDISTLSLRYADTERRNTYTAILNTRYPISESWRITPKFQVDYRVNNILEGEQWRLRPSLRIEYKMPRRWRFEIDGGYSWADEELEGLAEDRRGYYVSVGLRKDF